MYSLFKTKKFATDKKNLLEALKLLKENLKKEGDEYKKFKIKKVGRLLEGCAYYHEVDKFYNCVGFEVEIEYQFDFMDSPKTSIGFYSIWVGKAHKYAPIEFDESYTEFGKANVFYNGYGDKIEIAKELASIEEVQKIIADNNLF